MQTVAPILILVVAMTVSGAAGGLANYYLTASDDPTRTTIGLSGFMLLGAIVAFTIPLFLSLAQSSLVSTILMQKDAIGNFDYRYSELLVFSGFCIVAAFASRGFMDSLSNQVIALAGKAQKIAAEARDQASEAKDEAEKTKEAVELIDESLDRTSSSIQMQPQGKAAADSAANIELSPLELKVLQAASKYTLRTLTGIAKDAGIRRSLIGEITDQLIPKGLIEYATSPNTGGPRYRVTALGVALLNRSSGGDREQENLS